MWILLLNIRDMILCYMASASQTAALDTNRPISQIPQCTIPISYNAPFPYPTMHHFVTNVHKCAHFSYKMVHCGIFIPCIEGLVRWYLSHHWGICEMVLFPAMLLVACITRGPIQGALIECNQCTLLLLATSERARGAVCYLKGKGSSQLRKMAEIWPTCVWLVI